MATLTWIATTAGSWATGANWSTGSAPVNGDTCIFNHLGTGSVTSGLATGLTSGTTTLIIEAGYTGQIGAVAAGVATYLTFAATVTALNVYLGQQTGEGSGQGSNRIFIDSTNVTTATMNLYDTASGSGDTYYPPCLLKGTWTVNQYGGSYGLAARPGETGTLTAGSISADGFTIVSPAAYFGTGATVTRLDASIGSIYSKSSNTTATLNLMKGSAKYTYEGSGVHTAASVYSGSTYLDKGSGNIATFNLAGGTYQRRSTTAITVGSTAANFYSGTYDIDNGKAGTTTTSNKALTGCGVGNGLTVITPIGSNW